jgi:hypothetical protein
MGLPVVRHNIGDLFSSNLAGSSISSDNEVNIESLNIKTAESKEIKEKEISSNEEEIPTCIEVKAKSHQCNA